MKIIFMDNIYIKKYLLKEIKKNIFLILNIFFPKYMLDLFITNNKKMQLLNYKFRNINFTTDVLSFPIYNFKNAIPLESLNIDVNNKIFIGDIIISFEKVIEQSLQFNNTIEKEFTYLFIHSILHLIGYDHNTKQEKDIMRNEEKKILDKLNF